MRTYTIFLLILTIYLQSCTVIKDVQHEKIIGLNKANYTKLNGVYSNSYADTTIISYHNNSGVKYRPKTLWSHTYGFNNGSENGSPGTQTVKLEFKTPRQIQLFLYEKDSLIRKRVIRGRIKDGFFYRKPHIILIPLIPIGVFFYDTYRYRIGMINNGLVIDYNWNYWGFAWLAGGTGKGQTSTIFEKK